MARLPYVDPNDAPEPVRTALEGLPPLNIFRMIANADTALRPFLRYGNTLLAHLALDPLLRELAILQVSRLTPHAEYEWVQHVPIAKAVGAGTSRSPHSSATTPTRTASTRPSSPPCASPQRCA